MGHYASEMPRSEAEIEHDRIFDRSLELREEIKDIPLGFFSVSDLEPLIKLTKRPMDLYGEELEQLEKKVKDIREGKIDLNPIFWEE